MNLFGKLFLTAFAFVNSKCFTETTQTTTLAMLEDQNPDHVFIILNVTLKESLGEAVKKLQDITNGQMKNWRSSFTYFVNSLPANIRQQSLYGRESNSYRKRVGMLALGFDRNETIVDLIYRYEISMNESLSPIQLSSILLFGDPFYKGLLDPFNNNPIAIRFFDVYKHYKFKNVVMKKKRDEYYTFDSEYDKEKFRIFVDDFCPKKFLHTPVAEIPTDALQLAIKSFETAYSFRSKGMFGSARMFTIDGQNHHIFDWKAAHAYDRCLEDPLKTKNQIILCPHFRRFAVRLDHFQNATLHDIFMQSAQVLTSYRTLFLYHDDFRHGYDMELQKLVDDPRHFNDQQYETYRRSLATYGPNDFGLWIIFLNFTGAKEIMDVIETQQVIDGKENISNSDVLKALRMEEPSDPFLDDPVLFRYFSPTKFCNAKFELLHAFQKLRNGTCLQHLTTPGIPYLRLRVSDVLLAVKRCKTVEAGLAGKK